jgi:hypothetical protein
MPPRTGPHATRSNADAYDVRVLAFAGSAPRTLRGLRELFGIDDDTASRLLTSVPAVVRRAAPANEAQRYAQALESIGAQVVVERHSPPTQAARPALPPVPPLAARRTGATPSLPVKVREFSLPPTADEFSLPPTAAEIDLALASAGSQLPPLAADTNDLPQPVMPLMAADLEFDALARPLADDSIAMPLPAGSLAAPAADAAQPQPSDRRNLRRHQELDLAARFSGGVDLELGASASWQATVRPGGQERTERTRPASNTGAHKTTGEAGVNSADSAPTNVQRIAPMSRAEVVPRVAPVARPSKALPLARVLGAVVIAVVGLHFDNTIVFGNANWFSVVLHGLALHQLLLGVWGLTR